MALDGLVLDGPFSKITASALNANVLVTIDTSGNAALCGVGGVMLGSVQDAWASGVLATVFPPRGRHKLTAGGAIAIGDFVKAAANGKVVVEATNTVRTANTIGQADSASSADGDPIYIFLCA